MENFEKIAALNQLINQEESNHQKKQLCKCNVFSLFLFFRSALFLYSMCLCHIRWRFNLWSKYGQSTIEMHTHPSIRGWLRNRSLKKKQRRKSWLKAFSTGWCLTEMEEENRRRRNLRKKGKEEENEILGWNSRSNKTPSGRIFAHWMKPMKHCQLFSVLLDRPLLCLKPIGRYLTGSSFLEWIPFTATSRLDTAQLDKTIADFTFAQLQCKVSLTPMTQLSYMHTYKFCWLFCSNFCTFSWSILWLQCYILNVICFFLYFSLSPSSIWSTSIICDTHWL